MKNIIKHMDLTVANVLLVAFEIALSAIPIALDGDATVMAFMILIVAPMTIIKG